MCHNHIMTHLTTAIDWATCKLIFPFGSITEEGVRQLLAKYTGDFAVANFYPDREIGCNHTTFAIVDVPQKVIQQLHHDARIQEIDPMTTYSKKPSKECDGGSCGCGAARKG
jgi:hypothetical protein